MSTESIIPGPMGFATSRRGPPDPAFIATHRALGRSDRTIAYMLQVALEDVTGVSAEPVSLCAVERPAAAKPMPLDALSIPDVAEIIYHIAEQYYITPGDIMGPSHRPDIVAARHEALAVVRELNRYSLRDLAEMFGKTNTAVHYGLERHYRRLAADDRSGW